MPVNDYYDVAQGSDFAVTSKPENSVFVLDYVTGEEKAHHKGLK